VQLSPALPAVTGNRQARSDVQVTRKNIVKKSIEMFNEVAENKDEYNKFYEASART
jgi:molecular chaperone HtpG